MSNACIMGNISEISEQDLPFLVEFAADEAPVNTTSELETEPSSIAGYSILSSSRSVLFLCFLVESNNLI